MRLRELERSDLETLNRWRNAPEVVEWLGAPFLYIGPEVDAQWFDEYLKARDRNIRLAILADDDRFVGCVNLTGMHPVNRSAELSIWIGETTHWSQGLGFLACAAALEHAFRDRNLHRVFLYVLVTNERAIRLYRKLGFVEEGRLREAAFKQGRFVDLLVMSVLAGEFAPPAPGL
jgi:diamine N-acetyltransferase